MRTAWELPFLKILVVAIGKPFKYVRVHLNLTPAVRKPNRTRWPTSNEAALLAGATDPERAYIERNLPHKLALQADYAARAMLGSDQVVLVRTLRVLVLR